MCRRRRGRTALKARVKTPLDAIKQTEQEKVDGKGRQIPSLFRAQQRQAWPSESVACAQGNATKNHVKCCQQQQKHCDMNVPFVVWAYAAPASQPIGDISIREGEGRAKTTVEPSRIRWLGAQQKYSSHPMIQRSRKVSSDPREKLSRWLENVFAFVRTGVRMKDLQPAQYQIRPLCTMIASERPSSHTSSSTSLVLSREGETRAAQENMQPASTQLKSSRGASSID